MCRLGKNDTFEMARVNRNRIRSFLQYLKANNPLYANIIISEENLLTYPEVLINAMYNV